MLDHCYLGAQRSDSEDLEVCILKQDNQKVNLLKFAVMKSKATGCLF